MGKFNTHDSHIKSIFEIIGSYFCDTIFNHIYANAVTNLANGGQITDEYVRRVHAYVLGIKNDKKCYTDVIQSVHLYFRTTTRFTTLSFADFVDKIVAIAVPDEYFQQFTVQDKDELLCSIICDLVSNLAVFATKPEMLKRIIDEHNVSPDITIRILQDRAVEFLSAKRFAILNKFLHKSSQAREHISMDAVDGMKKTIKQLIREKTELTAELERKNHTIKTLTNDWKEREAKFLKLIKLLRMGGEKGPAHVGMQLMIPQIETIAEPPPKKPMKKTPPIREVIAEKSDDILIDTAPLSIDSPQREETEPRTISDFITGLMGEEKYDEDF